MLLSSIIKQVNKLVGNGSSFALTYNQLQFYIETTVDYINGTLQTQVPTPQEDWDYNRPFYNIVYSPLYLGDVDELPRGIKEGSMCYCNIDQTFYYYIETEGVWQPISIATGAIKNTDKFIPNVNIGNSKYNYQCMKDEIIRNVLCYKTAASYLEEEDEFESQYSQYKQKADEYLYMYTKIYYSVYDTGPKPIYKPITNPYALGDEDE